MQTLPCDIRGELEHVTNTLLKREKPLGWLQYRQGASQFGFETAEALARKETNFDEKEIEREERGHGYVSIQFREGEESRKIDIRK